MIDGAIVIVGALVLTLGIRRVLTEGLRVTVGWDLADGEGARDAVVAMARAQHGLLVWGATGLVAPLPLALPVVGATVVKLGVVLLAAGIVPVLAITVIPGLGARVPRGRAGRPATRPMRPGRTP